jgi:uncharacterized membrane protein
MAVAVPVEIVRILAAVPLALFLPGYATLAVAFGARRPPTPTLLVASVGTSLSVLALSGLLLDLLPGGIETLTWAILLLALVLACCRGAALRRGPGRRAGPRLRVPRLARRDLGLLVAAAAIATAAFVLAQTPLPAGKATGFTALWMLPGAGERSVEVGVVSSEHDRRDYLLRLEGVRGQAPRSSRFGLEPGEEKTFRLPVSRGTAAHPTRVTASLYQVSEPGHLYRRVVSWMPRKKGLP